MIKSPENEGKRTHAYKQSNILRGFKKDTKNIVAIR